MNRVWRLATAVAAWSMVLPVSAASAEPSLQAIVDGLFGPGVIAVPSHETGEETFAAGTRRAEILVEFAGHAGSNTFGWYPVANPSQLNTVFGGADGPGAVRVVPIPEPFGVFSSTPDGLWRSQRVLNADGFDHWQIYAYPGVPGGFLAALEDLPGGGDRDYNDMVVSVRPVDTAPPRVDLAFGGPDGQNGWYVTSPVTGTFTADDSSTGGSAIVAIACSGASVGPITGIGTPVATAPVTVTGDSTHTVACTATDAAGHSATTPPQVVRIDSTAPTVRPDSGADACSLPGTPGWCRGTQTAGFAAADGGGSGVASPCAGDPCTFVRSRSANGAGVFIPSGPVSDEAGNTVVGVDAGPFNIDSIPPDISITVPGDGQVVLMGATVAADYACADATSGVAACAGPVPDGAPLSTGAAGSHAFTVTAADVAGNAASRTHTYRVVFNFGGFYPPIDNPPSVNSVKAGSAVPVKFSLSGDQGLAIFASGYPLSHQVNCQTGALENEVEATASAGSSTLTYDPGTDWYHYTWKTEKAWAGTCRELVVRLVDGTDHVALFRFK